MKWFANNADYIAALREAYPAPHPAVQIAQAAIATHEYAREESMRLPDGKTCSECRHFRLCAQLIDADGTETECDCAPSRFKPNVPGEERAA
jgi:hypothetical protein